MAVTRNMFPSTAEGLTQYQQALKQSQVLPAAPTAQSTPVSMPTSQAGTIKQQLDSGLNAGGQALSSVQKANLQSQYDQETGKVSNTQALANKETATKNALQTSSTINRFAAVTPQSIAAQSKLNDKYQLGSTTGLNGMDPYDPSKSGSSFELMRNHEKEAAMASKLGGLPQNAEELDQFYKATYSPAKLKEMGYVSPSEGGSTGGSAGAAFSSGVAGTTPLYDPAKLAELGLDQARLDKLVASGMIKPEMLESLKSSGNAANIAQSNLNATAKPTNSMMGVLQEALQAKNNFQNQNLGTSDLFTKTGLSGYEVLSQSLGQRSKDMDQKFQSAASLVKSTGGAMADVYKGLLEGYQSAKDDYNKQTDRLLQADQRAQEHEWALESMQKQADLQEKATQKAHEWEKANPSLQYQAETEDSSAGYFNPKDGTFTPLSTGGNSYKPVSYGDYVNNASSSTKNTLNYDAPQPHGSANENVVSSNPKLCNIYKNGYQKAAGPNGYGGQCAYEVEQWTDLPAVGNTINQKATALAQFVHQGKAFYKGQGEPQVGYSVISNDDPKYGHVWLINAITDEGKLVASEFNRAGTRVFSNNRVVDPNDKSILGFVKTTVKPQYQVEGVGGKLPQGKVNLMSWEDYNKEQAGLQSPDSSTPGKETSESQMSSERQLFRSGQADASQVSEKRRELEKEVKKGRMDPAVLEQFNSDILYGKQGAGKESQRLPADKVVMLEDAKFLPKTLDNLEKTINSGAGTFSPIWSKIDAVNPLAWYDSNKQGVAAELRTAAQLVGKYMEGGVLRAEDEVKYRNMLPNNSDTREIAVDKLKKIRTMLQDKTEGYLQGFNASGYDVKGYMDSLTKLSGGAQQSPGGNVNVLGPDGNTYSMSAQDAQQAIKEGGKILN